MNGHGASEYRAGCRCKVCREGHRARNRADRVRRREEFAARHELAGQIVSRCVCAWCVGARRLRDVPAVVELGRDVRAVVCCEVEAFEPEGSGHDPYCPTRIGGAA